MRATPTQPSVAHPPFSQPETPLIEPLSLLRALVKAAVLPPLGPLLIALLGLILLRRKPRLGRALAWLGVGLLFALATPLVSSFLLRAVATAPVFDPAAARGAGAIVILGGGVRRDALEYGGDTLARLTLERVRYGARIAKQLKLPVLVSGGSLDGADAEAALMKNALESEFGVEVRWAEATSRNTQENAVESAVILRGEGINKIVLVAHSFDIRRAAAEFREVGIESVPAPTLLPGEFELEAMDLVPTLPALNTSYFALYELFGNAAFEVRRRISTRPADLPASIPAR